MYIGRQQYSNVVESVLVRQHSKPIIYFLIKAPKLLHMYFKVFSDNGNLKFYLHGSHSSHLNFLLPRMRMHEQGLCDWGWCPYIYIYIYIPDSAGFS